MAGYADRQTLVEDLAWWGDDFVLTGIQAQGRRVYRFTPDIDNAHLPLYFPL